MRASSPWLPVPRQTRSDRPEHSMAESPGFAGRDPPGRAPREKARALTSRQEGADPTSRIERVDCSRAPRRVSPSARRPDGPGCSLPQDSSGRNPAPREQSIIDDNVCFKGQPLRRLSTRTNWGPSPPWGYLAQRGVHGERSQRSEHAARGSTQGNLCREPWVVVRDRETHGVP